MKIAVTGATGYIGRHLIIAAEAAGYDVVALSRTPFRKNGIYWLWYELTDNKEPLFLPKDINAVFHLAAETKNNQSIQTIELAAAKRLMNAARSVEASFVFVSSQTSRSNAPTAYGQIKWQIERMVLAEGELVIRPGLVYGGAEEGLFGTLCTFVRSHVLMPSFIPEPVIQPVHVDDLAAILLRCPSLPPSSLLCIGSPEGVTFTEFLKAIAYGRSCRQPFFFPLPRVLLNLATWVIRPRLQNKISLDSLSSLLSLPMMDTADDLDRFSVKLRLLSAGVSRSGSTRRALIREGRALLFYVMREKPESGLVRRYVRAIEALREPQAISLPRFVIQYPALLGFLDGARGINQGFKGEFKWRLNSALLLAEACPQGALRFIGSNKSYGWTRSCFQMIWILALEVGRRIGQFIASPLLSRIARRGVFE